VTIEHVYGGNCPDENQPDARDRDCPACAEMGRHDTMLAEVTRAFRAYVTEGEKNGHLPRVQWLMALHAAEEMVASA
jgi:hypothetical protein